MAAVSVAVTRRLFLQRAPAEEVLRACKASEDWSTLAGQEALHAALVTDPAAKQVNRTYKQRCLKALLHALDGHEICEGLLEAYISNDLLGATAKGSDGPSIRTFEVNGAALELHTSDEIGGEAETSGCLWPACPALAAWLQAHASELTGATVLELGSGTGLASLTVACCADVKTVVATDNSLSALSRLRESAKALDSRIGSRVHVAALDWLANAWLDDDDRDAEPAAHAYARPAAELPASPFDLVIGSDLAYNPLLLRPLCRTLGAILRASAAGGALSPRAWLAAERRSAETWAMLLEELQREELTVSDLSEPLRSAAAAQSTFYCAAESIGRLHLLEIRATTHGGDGHHGLSVGNMSDGDVCMRHGAMSTKGMESFETRTI
eukprot:scaffold19388_cov116-Isochrysis_galbana.AAC.4